MPQTTETFSSLVYYILDTYANPLIVILAGIAIIVFFWGIIKFIYAAGDEKKLQNGRSMIVWGIVAIFVIFCLGGIVALLQNTFFGSSTINSPASSGSYIDTSVPNPGSCGYNSLGEYTCSS